MEDCTGEGWSQAPRPPSVPRYKRRWLIIGGLALAFMFTLGVGALLGSTTSASHVASAASSSANSSQAVSIPASNFTNANPQSADAPGNFSNAQSPFAGPGAQGQCVSLTVSSVNGNTIMAKTSSGSSVTVHTTASTTYRQADQTVTASAVKVGSLIHVMGTHNSDGSITATSIDIG